MMQMVEFLARHGYWVLFLSVLGRQACLPVPANLLLLAAGALVGLGKLNLAGIIASAVVALLLADTAWYGAGRKWGARTLEFVYGATGGPAGYVGKISGNFRRHGVRWLLISKFLIGVDAVAAPIAGITRTGLPRFLFFDALGAILWSSAYTAVGYIFCDQLDHIAAYIPAMWKLLVLAGFGGLGILMIFKLVRWYRSAQIRAGADYTAGDATETECRHANSGFGFARPRLDPGSDVLANPGAARIDPGQLNRYIKEQRGVDLAIDREAILYCASPGEATSARAAWQCGRKELNMFGRLQAGCSPGSIKPSGCDRFPYFVSAGARPGRSP